MTAEPTRHAGALPRVFALGVLTALVTGALYVAQEIYRAATDSFIAPIILSPDNDAVISNKLSLSQLELERAKTATELQAMETDLAAGEQAMARLKRLQSTVSRSLAWVSTVNRRLAAAGAVEQRTLADQRAVLADMTATQRRTAERARKNLDAGLIANTDYIKEALALRQLEVAELENSRTRTQADAQVGQVELSLRSLARGGAPAMPELILQEDQLVRIELDLLKLEAEQRAKLAEKQLAQDKLAKIDELEAQLRARPIFRAAERSLEVAFVPYTQSDGVRPGAPVYACTWGLFNCKHAGKVTEIVPGEVILPDPWGNQARGHYAVLALEDHDAARSKTLRVRAVR